LALDHHVNLRPARLYPGVATPLSGEPAIDFVVVREGTEGPYAGNGGVLRKGTPHEIATEVSVNTAYGVERVVRDAFGRAQARPRKHLTLVHKNNVLTNAGDLWFRIFERVGSEFPDVAVAYNHVDAATIYLVTDPGRFDVIVTDNLFGGVTNAVIFVLLARQLHLSAGVIGLLTSLSAVGGLLGSLFASRFAAKVGQGPAIWMSAAACAPGAFVAPFLHRDWTLALYAAGQVLFWGWCVVYNITQVSFRQGLTPPALLGRMNATMRFLVWGTMPLGAFIGGVLGSTIGVRGALLVAAIGGCMAFVPVLLSPLRTMRELPHYVPDDETAGPLVGSAP
jgi:hypothetical protein